MISAAKQSAVCPKRVLFLEKVFLRKTHGASEYRGVELFNLKLIADMARSGVVLDVVAHKSWHEILSAQGVNAAGSFWFGGPWGPVLGSLFPAISAAKVQYDALLLANVGNSVIPAAYMVGRFGTVGSTCLIAHRTPSALFCRFLKRLQPTVVGVNTIISAEFRSAGYPDVSTYYGVCGAEMFHPGKKVNSTGTVNFGVLGRLDSAWKGADTAIAAFRALPKEWKGRTCLHLTAFSRPPRLRDKNIVVHQWLPADQTAMFLRGLDVLIVPSRDERVMRETFSQAMVQGMLTGLPIIASDLPVLTEKLEQGGGLIFASPGQLVDAIVHLASSPQLRLKFGEQARQIALSRYVWDTRTFMERYLFKEKI